MTYVYILLATERIWKQVVSHEVHNILPSNETLTTSLITIHKVCTNTDDIEMV